MRILAVTPYHEPEGGGLERYAHAILSRLVRRGHTVRLICLTRQGLPSSEHDGVTVLRVPAQKVLGNTPIHLGFGRIVAQECRSFRPDVVVAHTPVPFPAEMAHRAARRLGIPFVTTYHAGRLRGSSWLLERIARLDARTLQRRMLAESAALIAVSPYVRDHALAGHVACASVIPPGVDLDHHAQGEPNPAPEILFVAPVDSAYRWKGLDVLWEAFALVQRRVPDAALRIVGTGDRMAEFARKAQHRSDIQLAGRLDDAGLAEAYRRAAVTVLPSTTDAESFGMVLAEANACGRPVVGSMIGGIPCFVRHGDNGLLCKPGDAEALADALATVLEDPKLAAEMGRRGRDRVRREHNWDDLAARTEDVLAKAARIPLVPVPITPTR